MARQKTTIHRDSVFRQTGDAPTEASPSQGVASEPSTRQTAVWLAEAEIEWLDDQCQIVRRAGWRSMTRSALIRGLIRASMDRSLDLGGVSSEQELTRRLRSTE